MWSFLKENDAKEANKHAGKSSCFPFSIYVKDQYPI